MIQLEVIKNDQSETIKLKPSFTPGWRLLDNALFLKAFWQSGRQNTGVFNEASGDAAMWVVAFDNLATTTWEMTTARGGFAQGGYSALEV